MHESDLLMHSNPIQLFFMRKPLASFPVVLQPHGNHRGPRSQRGRPRFEVKNTLHQVLRRVDANGAPRKGGGWAVFLEVLVPLGRLPSGPREDSPSLFWDLVWPGRDQTMRGLYSTSIVRAVCVWMSVPKAHVAVAGPLGIRKNHTSPAVGFQ